MPIAQEAYLDSTMSKPIPFSEYEAAILLDAFLKVEGGEIDRQEAIINCSQELRKMAESQGKAIDDTYRSVAGITFQIASMESAYRGKTIMKPATTLFVHIVDLFRTKPKEYERILQVAKGMTGSITNYESEFMEWLSDNVSVAQLTDLIMAARDVEERAIKSGIISKSLYEQADEKIYKEIKSLISKSRVFKVLHKEKMWKYTSLLDYLIQYSQEIVTQKETGLEIVANISKGEKRSNDVLNSANNDFNGRDEEKYIIDFDAIPKLTFTCPVSFKYFGEEYAERSWRSLYADCCKALIEDYPQKFKDLRRDSMNGNTKRWLVDKLHRYKITAPKKIADDYYIEANRSAFDMVTNIKWLLDACSIDYENIQIVYKNVEQKKGGALSNDSINEASEALPKIQEAYQNGRFLRDDKEQLLRWLIDNKGLNDDQAAQIVRLVKQAEDYAKENESINCKLLSGSKEEIHKTIELLANNKSFTERNYLRNNKWFKALRLYVEYAETKYGAIHFTKNRIIFNKSGKNFVRQPSCIIAWTIYGDFKKPIVYKNTEEDYIKWLERNDSLPEATCKRYAAAIAIAERYSLLNEYSEQNIFGSEANYAAETINRILDDDVFLKTYSTYAKAIKKYLSFLHFLGAGHEVAEQQDAEISSKLYDESDENASLEDHESYTNANTEEDYRRWLISRNITGTKPKKHIEAIYISERYAILNDYKPFRLFGADNLSAISVIRALLDDDQFVKTYSNYKSQLKEYLQFLEQSDNTERKKQQRAKAWNDPYLGQTTKKASEVLGEEEQALKEQISSILERYYKYGFKYDSIREIMRFRQFAEAENILLPRDDEELQSIIVSSGILIDGKVFYKNDNMLRELKQIVKRIQKEGFTVIYYESLFDSMQNWMETNAIASPELLKEMLATNISGWSFSKKFMSQGKRLSEKEAVSDEIIQFWGLQQTESIDSLNEKLPYIPINNILRVISGNDQFAFSGDGEYLLIDRLHITKEEERMIIAFVEDECKNKGYASLSDIPLDSIQEENFELSKPAIINAITKKILNGKYNIKGKIITKKNDVEINAVQLLKQYIHGRDECTFNEVADKVFDLTGGNNRQYAFQALYDEMIRIGKNHFISNNAVEFEIDEIDSILSSFVTDRFASIRDVTTFAMFPLCGQSWNHYLLESFCYKYSHKFSLHVVHFNDKNAGIIAEKDYNKSYAEMLAIEIARKGIDDNPDAIGKYFFDTGYMAKSKSSILSEVSERVKELRNEGAV